jgi:hypothetical protein
LEHLKATLESQGTELKFGDILLIRSGFIDGFNQKSKDDLLPLTKKTPPAFGGVEQSEDVLKWIWENFSAVAGDQPSFEAWRKFTLRLQLDHWAYTLDQQARKISSSMKSC